MTGHLQVYLDSDNLKNLEELFDTVRSHTRNLVVLATPAVFQRPWCAGEITCAYSSQIPVFLINFVNGGQDEETNPSGRKFNERCSCTYFAAHVRYSFGWLEADFTFEDFVVIFQ